MKEEMEPIEPFVLPFISSLLSKNLKKLKIYSIKKIITLFFILWLISGMVSKIQNKKIEIKSKPKLIKSMNKRIK